jgi:hypothetical protein
LEYPPTACDDPLVPGCGSDPFALTDGLGGVIDNAVLRDRVRLRYDHFKGVNFPDRAEYLFGAVQEVGGPAGTAFRNVKYQEIRTYVEWRFHRQVSIFGELPVRFVDNAISRLDLAQESFETHNRGAGDVTAGLRYALLQKPGSHLTAQLKIYAPTGDVGSFLGTGHPAIEAGFLFQHQWDRLTVFGELLDWQASAATLAGDNDQFAGERFSGNVLRYGLGAGYDLGRRVDHHRISRLTLLGEIVGWTVIDGLKTDQLVFQDPEPGAQRILFTRGAAGDTIVNGVFGLRYTIGPNTVYIGYGTAWSEQRWYTDQFRLEFGHNF